MLNTYEVVLHSTNPHSIKWLQSHEKESLSLPNINGVEMGNTRVFKCFDEEQLGYLKYKTTKGCLIESEYDDDNESDEDILEGARKRISEDLQMLNEDINAIYV